MSRIVECVVCGKTFTARDCRQKCCSRDCRLAVRRENDKKYREKAATIEKTCEYCGKKFFAHTEEQRFCDKSCAARHRYPESSGSFTKPKKEAANIVKIRIKRPLNEVFDELQPVVGAVYEAEKPTKTGKGSNQIYIIRGVGKYGLIVRCNECEEIRC